MIKRALSLLLLLSILTLATPTALAATQFAAETLRVSEVQDDVYAAGGQVTIAGPVSDDVSVAGAMVAITSDIAGDLLAVGGDINLSGAIGDDARVGGGNVVIRGAIGDDLVVAGGAVTVTSEATIGGDVLVTGGMLILEGTVAGNVLVGGGQVIINGTIEGELKAVAEDIIIGGVVHGNTELAASTNLQVSSNAEFKKDVRYWTGKGEENFGSVVAGQLIYDVSLSTKGLDIDFNFLSNFLFAALISLLMSAAVLLVLVLFNKSFIGRTTDVFATSFWKSAGIGLLFFIVTPLIAGFLFMTIVGIPLGVLAIFIYIVSLYVTKIVTAMVVAKWLGRRWKQDWSKLTFYFVALGLLVVIQLISIIPIVGWVALLIPSLATFGALLRHEWTTLRSVR